MSVFKVGDKVEVVSLGLRSSGYGVRIGMVGEVVVKYAPDYECVGVSFDHNIDGHSLCHNGKDALRHDATNGLWIEPENLKLVEEKEKQMTPQLKNMKIRIKDKEHSRLVQEALFEMGYGWDNNVKKVQFTFAGVLFTETSGIITWAYADPLDSYPAEEVELVTTYSFKVVDQEAKRKAAEKEALQKNVAEMQRQLEEMKQKLEKM